MEGSGSNAQAKMMVVLGAKCLWGASVFTVEVARAVRFRRPCCLCCCRHGCMPRTCNNRNSQLSSPSYSGVLASKWFESLSVPRAAVALPTKPTRETVDHFRACTFVSGTTVPRNEYVPLVATLRHAHRAWQIPLALIEAKATHVLWPPSRMRSLNQDLPEIHRGLQASRT